MRRSTHHTTKRYLKILNPVFMASAESIAITRYSTGELLSLVLWLIYFGIGIRIIVYVHKKLDILGKAFLFLVYEVGGVIMLIILNIPNELFIWLLLLLISVPLLYILIVITYYKLYKTSIFTQQYVHLKLLITKNLTSRKLQTLFQDIHIDLQHIIINRIIEYRLCIIT